MTLRRVAFLGDLRLDGDEGEVFLPGEKLRHILVILAWRAGETVSRDELIEELGLFRTTSNTTNALHAHMARLRRWLRITCQDGDILATAQSGYRLDIDRGNVDAHRFVTQVEAALKIVPAAPSIVVTMLEEALALWRSRALVDLVDGAVGSAAADELFRLRAIARETLLDAWLALNCSSNVIQNARRFITDDPLNERLWTQLIVALRRAGRHAEAVQSYLDAQKELNEELGVRPSDELRSSIDGALGNSIFMGERKEFIEGLMRQPKTSWDWGLGDDRAAFPDDPAPSRYDLRTQSRSDGDRVLSRSRSSYR